MLERPLYRQVADQIEAHVSEGLYAPGQLLPPEPALEQMFGVSRITIRQALGLLKRRGLLESRSGVGTLVRPGATDRTSVRFTGSLRDLVYYASATRYTPLGKELKAPPSEVASQLGTDRAEAVYCFKGMRGRPNGDNFCLEEIYVPEPFGRRLDNSRLGKSPLFMRLEEANRVKITEVEQTINAVSARAALARQLGVPDRAAVLKAVRVYRLADGRIAEVVVSYYDPEKFSYVMTLILA